MTASEHRVQVDLDDEHAATFERLAARANADPGALARVLLSAAIDEIDADEAKTSAALEGIDGAFEAATRGLAEGPDGAAVQLEDL